FCTFFSSRYTWLHQTNHETSSSVFCTTRAFDFSTSRAETGHVFEGIGCSGGPSTHFRRKTEYCGNSQRRKSERTALPRRATSCRKFSATERSRHHNHRGSAR